MADIFISYSKKHAALTESLARDLEAEGYTTWWDTNLLPDDGFFPETIRAEIAAAKAVIVIWAEHSVTSRWVYSEASEGDAHGKLFQVRDEALDPRKVPMPFTSGNITLVKDRAKIFAALARLKIKLQPVPGHLPPPISSRLPIFQRGPIMAQVTSGLKPGHTFRDFDSAPEMVVIPAGAFMMGSKDGGVWGWGQERPVHKVTIPQAFAAGKYPVTFAEWDAAVAAGGVSRTPGDAGWGRGRRPVIKVSWDDAQAYIRWLNSKVGGYPYRLLSEAEWEYACRAGTTTAYSFGDTIRQDQAEFSDNVLEGIGKDLIGKGKTVEVGFFPTNAFGLHDMHGNVWEWCQDCWHNNYKGAPNDGSAWTAGDCDWRVARGGSWYNAPGNSRSAYRLRLITGYRVNCLGFRVGRILTS